jgi:hypothetical protein
MVTSPELTTTLKTGQVHDGDSDSGIGVTIARLVVRSVLNRHYQCHHQICCSSIRIISTLTLANKSKAEVDLWAELNKHLADCESKKLEKTA